LTVIFNFCYPHSGLLDSHYIGKCCSYPNDYRCSKRELFMPHLPFPDNCHCGPPVCALG
jgi:hypothetical protein